MKKTSLLVALLMYLSVAATHAQTFTSSRSYAYHPSFIYHFCRFIEWPEAKQEIIIGVLGNSPINQELERMAKVKSSYQMTFTIKKFDRVEALSTCDILFVPANFSGNLQDVWKRLGGRSVLVVTEDEKHLHNGTCINFINRDGRIMFQIDKKQVDKTRLKISPKLLNLGIIV